jgi:hypothetical protein
MKPRLTRNVLDGLISMAAAVDAGSAADFCGYDEEQMEAAGDTYNLEKWHNAQKAVTWIFAMETWKQQQRTRGRE